MQAEARAQTFRPRGHKLTTSKGILRMYGCGVRAFWAGLFGLTAELSCGTVLELALSAAALHKPRHQATLAITWLPRTTAVSLGDVHSRLDTTHEHSPAPSLVVSSWVSWVARREVRLGCSRCVRRSLWRRR